MDSLDLFFNPEGICATNSKPNFLKECCKHLRDNLDQILKD